MTRSLAELLRGVNPRFREDFLGLLRGGQASPEFMDYLDSNQDCQDAFELAFREDTKAIHEAVRQIRSEVSEQPAQATRARTSTEENREM